MVDVASINRAGCLLKRRCNVKRVSKAVLFSPKFFLGTTDAIIICNSKLKVCVKIPGYGP